ncbi:MAG: 30S ribosomal protein S12 methylthiotransferase RimO [bacterium]
MNTGNQDKSNRLIGIISLGCPKNTVDSERLMGDLDRFGWEFTGEIENADCLIVNTCGFIRDARLESEEAIAEICEIKRMKPGVILVVTGCLPQRDGIDLKKQFPEIDLVAGIGSLEKIPGLLNDILTGRQPQIPDLKDLAVPGRATLSMAADPRLRLTPPWTAWMKISEGCDHSCAFCVIPQIKGKHISRPVEDLVCEAVQLSEEGVKELILISQDTTAYGSDIGTNLRVLLKELDRIDGIEWIRMHYLYPSKVSDPLLEIIADSGHVIPYFDIPFQHTESRILKSMDRLAPDIDPVEIINRIRSRFENGKNPACIRTTLMVGFPGETDGDFGNMLEFVENARIDKLTVFRFSPEDGTSAATMPEQIPDDISESRMNLIMEIQYDISQEINEEFIGKRLDVLLEGFTDDGRRIGRSYRDAPEIDGLVLVENVPDEIEEGNIVGVKITGALPYDLDGEYEE